MGKEQLPNTQQAEISFLGGLTSRLAAEIHEESKSPSDKASALKAKTKSLTFQNPTPESDIQEKAQEAISLLTELVGNYLRNHPGKNNEFASGLLADISSFDKQGGRCEILKKAAESIYNEAITHYLADHTGLSSLGQSLLQS